MTVKTIRIRFEDDNIIAELISDDGSVYKVLEEKHNPNITWHIDTIEEGGQDVNDFIVKEGAD